MKIVNVPVAKIRHSSELLRDPKAGDIAGLAESLKSLGFLVPVMVRKNGTGYELVYGNRRFVAAKKARLKTIPALVGPASMTDDDELVCAIAENSAREPMTSLEMGKAIVRLRELGESTQEIAKKVNLGEDYVLLLAQLVSEPTEIKRLMDRPDGVGLTEYQVRATRKVEDEADRIALAKAAAKNELSAKDVQQRAELLSDARSPAVKKQIIEAEPGARFLSERWRKAAEKIEKQRAKVRKREDPRVREALDDLAQLQKDIGKWEKTFRAGRFSPEAARFAVRKIDSAIRQLESFRGRLVARGRETA